LVASTLLASFPQALQRLVCSTRPTPAVNRLYFQQSRIGIGAFRGRDSNIMAKARVPAYLQPPRDFKQPAVRPDSTFSGTF
jgi:hypothetical protein